MHAEVTRQVGRFAITGLLSTAIHVAVAAALIELAGYSSTMANGTAFVAATAGSYALNTLWSFASRPRTKSLVRFATVSSIGWLLTVSISAWAERLDLHYMVGIGLVVIAVPPATFVMHRYWTYR